MKRPREHFFRNPARRPRTGSIGLDSLPPTLVEQVLSYIYPEGCLEFMRKRQLQRMAERMFEGFAHNHQVMVFGWQALDVLTASESLDGMWHYRERLETFQSALHCRFVDYCLRTVYKFCNRIQYPCTGAGDDFDGHPAASRSAMPCPAPSMPEIAPFIVPT